MPGSIWTTELGHNIHVNISQENMMKMKETCKIFLSEITPVLMIQVIQIFMKKKENDNKEVWVFKNNITAVTVDGENVTGRIIHFISDNIDKFAFGYDTNWFLVKYK